jgi:hypothetical protein
MAGQSKSPATKAYRVCIVAATYLEPREVVGPTGDVTVQHVYSVGRFGEEIQLTEAQATRLLDLGAVKPADEPLTYEEMDRKQLDAAVKERGITVSGSGANGEVLDTDIVNALNTYDAGQAGATVKPGA